MPSLGRARVGCVGGNCQQLLRKACLLSAARHRDSDRLGSPDHAHLAAEHQSQLQTPHVFMCNHFVNGYIHILKTSSMGLETRQPPRPLFSLSLWES